MDEFPFHVPRLEDDWRKDRMAAYDQEWKISKVKDGVQVTVVHEPSESSVSEVVDIPFEEPLEDIIWRLAIVEHSQRLPQRADDLVRMKRVSHVVPAGRPPAPEIIELRGSLGDVRSLYEYAAWRMIGARPPQGALWVYKYDIPWADEGDEINHKGRRYRVFGIDESGEKWGLWPLGDSDE